MSPLVLMYNLDAPKGKGARIKMILTMMRVRFRSVCREEYALPVGALAGLSPGEPVDDGEDFSDEMLVFVDLGDKLLSRFLSECRRAGIPSVPLKAVLTPTNMAWSSSRLHAEIRREHEAMRSGGRAHPDERE